MISFSPQRTFRMPGPAPRAARRPCRPDAATSHMTGLGTLPARPRRRPPPPERADQELPVDADVPDAGSQRDQQARADDQQWRHLDERLVEPVRRAEAAPEQECRRRRSDRGRAPPERARRRSKAPQDRQQRRAERHEAPSQVAGSCRRSRRVGPPSIKRPSASTVASARSRTPTSSPLYITPMRSLTSSNLVQLGRDEQHDLSLIRPAGAASR